MAETVPFKTEYYNQVFEINEDQLLDRKKRLKAVHDRAQTRFEEKNIMRKKLQEQLQEKEKEDKNCDDKIEKLMTKFIGMGSATATKRILKEYKHFQTSADIQNLK